MRVSRRALVALLGAATLLPSRGRPEADPLDVTFIFTNDIHTCNIGNGLSPNCAQEGKTDRNLLRHIAGINRVSRVFLAAGDCRHAERTGRRRTADRGPAWRGDRRRHDR